MKGLFIPYIQAINMSIGFYSSTVFGTLWNGRAAKVSNQSDLS